MFYRPYKTYKKKRSKEEDLSNVPDINLSGFEKRKKKRQIRVRILPSRIDLN